MPGTYWNEGRFVFLQNLGLVADRHARRTAHADPVLSTMMMRLKRQPAAWLNNDPLNLKPLTLIDRLIGTPRAMDLEMLLRDIWRHFLEFPHPAAQAVAVLAPRDQHGVVGRNHDQVFDAEQRHKLLVACYIGAARIEEDY